MTKLKVAGLTAGGLGLLAVLVVIFRCVLEALGR